MQLAGGGSFDVQITATSILTGTFTNPRSGGICQVNPNLDVPESNEANDTATGDAVLVATLDVTISSGLSANNKVYDGTTTDTLSSNNVVLAGVLPGDVGDVALLTNGYTANFEGTGVGNNQFVMVSGLSLAGSAAGKYSLLQPSLSANITPAPLLVQAGDQTRGYGQANPVFGGTLTGLMNQDPITAAYACAAQSHSPGHTRLYPP